LLSKTNKRITSVSKEFLDALKQHHWNGNIRELKNVIERSVILSNAEELDLDSLPLEFHKYFPIKMANNFPHLT
jgi:two-component system NtrC family response regulator